MFGAVKIGAAMAGATSLLYTLLLYFYHINALSESAPTESPTPPLLTTFAPDLPLSSSRPPDPPLLSSMAPSLPLLSTLAPMILTTGKTNAQENVENTSMSYSRSDCRKFVMILAKRLMKVLNSCVKQVKEQHPEANGLDTYFQCAIKCALHEIKMIDENYLFSNATMNTFTEIHVPLKYHTMVHHIVSRCVTIYTKIITGKDDPFCNTYGDFIKCAQNDLSDKC